MRTCMSPKDVFLIFVCPNLVRGGFHNLCVDIMKPNYDHRAISMGCYGELSRFDRYRPT